MSVYICTAVHATEKMHCTHGTANREEPTRVLTNAAYVKSLREIFARGGETGAAPHARYARCNDDGKGTVKIAHGEGCKIDETLRENESHDRRTLENNNVRREEETSVLELSTFQRTRVSV